MAEFPCIFCGGESRTAGGDYTFRDPFLGIVNVPRSNWEQCCQCGEKVLNLATSRRIDVERKKLQTKLLACYPIGDFVDATEARRILGDISRQALAQTPKYRKKIYHFPKSGRVFYLRASVELFARTGDGRFPLRPQGPAASASASKPAFVVEGVSGPAVLLAEHFVARDQGLAAVPWKVTVSMNQTGCRPVYAGSAHG